jgi:ubiquinone/menaquinone biosynthesis C-methylase UbiE
MPFGSVFSGFKYVNLSTADNINVRFINSFLTKLGFILFGVPHIGLRLRAKKILSNLQNKLGNVLDAGCGSGVYSFSLSKKAERIESIDIDKDKIKYLNEVIKYNNINFSEGDICKLKFRDKEFDLIICSDVLEHVKCDNLAFSELSRVLKNGGTMLITVPYNSKKNYKNYKNYGHERPGYNEKNFAEWADKNNLKIEKLEFYSSNAAEIASDFLYKFNKSALILAVLFYPLYLTAVISDFFFCKKSHEGMFLKIRR